MAASADPGSSAVNGYVVSLSPGNVSCVASITSCTISGLAPGVTYTATVTASNLVGTSPPTGSISFELAAEPRSGLASTGLKLGALLAVSIGLFVLGTLALMGRRRRV